MSSRAARLPQAEFIAEVSDLAEDGRGVARIGEKVVFIAGALPGERVRARYTRRRRSLDEAAATAVEVLSPDRVEPPCPHFGTCGGCALQHLAPDAQVRQKERRVLEALRRLGRVEPEAVFPPVRGASTGYRRRARLGAKWVSAKARMLVGFRERDSAKLADLSRCLVLDARLGERLTALAAGLGALQVRDAIPQVELAAAQEVALVLRLLVPLPADDRERLAALERDLGVRFYLQPGGPSSVVPLTLPAPELRYTPAGEGLELDFQPTDFIQVNGEVSRRMVRQALDWLETSPGQRVLELFCGLGNFSLPLLARGVDLTALEGDAGLVERARANAARHGYSADFRCADLAAASAASAWQGKAFDRVLLDPPRTGAEAVLAPCAATGARRILYVSCHPGTLGRDAGILVHDHGYRLARVGVLDMFPHTGHVESMALFEAG